MLKTGNGTQRKLRRKAGSPRLPFYTSSPPAYSSPKEKADQIIPSEEFIVYQTWTLVCHTHYAKHQDPSTITKTVVTTSMKANKEIDLFIPISTNDGSEEVSASSRQAVASGRPNNAHSARHGSDRNPMMEAQSVSLDLDQSSQRQTYRYTISSTTDKSEPSKSRSVPCDKSRQQHSESFREQQQQSRASRRISIGSPQPSTTIIRQSSKEIKTCLLATPANGMLPESPGSSSTSVDSMPSTTRPKSTRSQCPPTSFRASSNTPNQVQMQNLSTHFQSHDLRGGSPAQTMLQTTNQYHINHIEKGETKDREAIGLAITRTPSEPRLRSRRHMDVSSARCRSTSISSSDTFDMSAETPFYRRPTTTVRSTPTPFTSPEPSPLLRKAGMVQARAISLPRTHSRPSSTLIDLPDAQEVYAQQSHYTKCPHSHPPCERPLNTLPTHVQFGPNVLKYPPFNLRPFLTANVEDAPMVSVIDGSCPSCDLSSRRHLEGAILSRYSDHLEMLEQELDLLDSLTDTDPSTAAASPSASTLSIYQASLQNIAAKIANIRQQQDCEVKKIWQGYTARWGPGTIGIHHEKRDSTATASICTKATRMTNNSIDGIIDEGRMRIDWIRPDLSE